MLLIKLVNDKTGDGIFGNYDYEVFINTTKIARGRVENHERSNGWQGLVKKLAARCNRAEKCEKTEDERIRELYKLIGNECKE